MSRVSENLYDATIPNFTVAFTTDNPAITANSTLTIADGDAATVTRAEYNELAVETATKINAILDALRATGVVKSSGNALTPSIGVGATSIADLSVVYTTDDPAITPDGTLTIADGDATTVTRAEYNEAVEEIAAKLNAVISALRVVGIVGS